MIDDIFAQLTRKRANALDAARRRTYEEMRREHWARKAAQATE